MAPFVRTVPGRVSSLGWTQWEDRAPALWRLHPELVRSPRELRALRPR
ncbi:MAG: hypothetical protein AVDCRST_MAG77-1109 [uncultured Chloroflexi bacterium]|uniref:Uncharacterized protein n=1 Tax=uncultured Chloroflexota bacterium TaxID=166587 RepID=A0A6J4HT00_9CHLR|nr:MAG: hypothetical protein AVDCRST_MAG77-1109 [uncultured Chloroflexota bacterium]